ncbi:hypothetical protein [Rhizobium sp. MHM7A]|uniref:hypothetical protein n=1 Tax=Rhizobium sp. MHM7A TaxID=2583233 RepID=UPI0011072A0E|nr:hypothetical protein [Rhizobium sp. MHM7A]TLX16328.1 hypothetical protein FFR93_03080 [Rhizobium sp. MHM7A]
MHIKISIGYNADVVEIGKRKPVETNFFEWIDIPIANPTSEEAPIAVAWREEQPVVGDRYQASYDQIHKYTALGVTPIDGFQHTRWYEGAHWWPILRKVEGEDRIPRGKRLTVEDYQKEWLTEMSGYPLGKAGVYYQTAKNFPDGKPIDLSLYRTVENNTREDRIRQFEEDIKQLIVVDGIVYQRLQEPVYVVGMNSYVNHDNQSVLRIIPNDPEKLPVKTQFWTMDRFEEAHEFAMTGNFRSERSKRESLNIEREAIVYIPESLKTDMDIQGMVADGELILRYCEDEKISKFSEIQAITYVKFRTAYSTFLEDKNPQPLYEAAVAYREAIGNGHSSLHDRLKSLIERQEMRPVKSFGARG